MKAAQRPEGYWHIVSRHFLRNRVAGAGLTIPVVIPTVPPEVAIVSWSIAGIGMGFAYSSLSLLVLRDSAPAEQGARQRAEVGGIQQETLRDRIELVLGGDVHAEPLDLHPVPLGQQEVAQLVDEDHEAQAQDDRQDRHQPLYDFQRTTSCRAHASTCQRSSSVGRLLNG